MGEPVSSPIRGVSRRDFLKYCAYVAGVIGVGKAGIPDVALAVEKLAKKPSVVWSSFQVCTGCAIQLLQAREPTVQNLILQQISLDYQDNVMAAAGAQAEEVLRNVVEAGDFWWVVEGSIPTKIPEAVMIAGRTAADIFKEIQPKAKATIAMGSCAAYGNIQASRPNPTGAMGINEFMQQEGISGKAINLPRCPGHGDDLITTLMYVLVQGKVPELDAVGRPTFLYGRTIHDICYRRGNFEAGRFVEYMGDPNTANDYCLYKVGCKGPVTFAPCGQYLWNGNVSWCVHNAPCQGCAEPGFWDKLTPFYQQVRGAEMAGPGGVPLELVGLAVGAATVVGIGAHAAGQTVRTRRGGAATDKGGDV